jgi:hypothetical protein
MTKWARMRKRKERKQTEESLRVSNTEGKEAKLTEPTKIPENIQHSQETKKFDEHKDSKPKPILAQIPRYVYLFGFFVLIAGIFFPLITPNAPYDLVIQGTAVLFLGLAGAILLFKAATSEKRQVTVIVIGFALIIISLALIFHFQGEGYFRTG